MARIAVKVVPKSSESRVAGLGPAGELKVKVHSAPEGGAANQELQRVLADFFGCAPSACRIIRGAASRRKLVELETLSDLYVKGKIQCLP